MNSPEIIIAQELPAGCLQALMIQEWEPQERPAFLALLEQNHYLPAPPPQLLQLCQAVRYQGRLVALIVWTYAAKHLAGRERFIGWDLRTCARRRGFIVQQSRFCLLPGQRPANLASRVLALSVAHLPGAWRERYGVTPLLAESFVDPERYAGTCYKAAGWIEVGRTAGFARVGSDYYVEHEQPKNLWLKLLDPGALTRLRDPSVPLAGEKQRAAGRMPVGVKQAESLSDALREVPDPRSRKGRQFPLHALLACAVLALSSGARTVRDIFRFCQDLTPGQRRSLGFRNNPQARAVVPPPGENCWRKVLREVDPQELTAAMEQWQNSQGQALPEVLAIDGKVIGKNLATLVSLVNPQNGQPLYQAACAGVGHEQALGEQILEKLPEGTLEGRTFAGDALYTQKALARKLVQGHGAKVMVQIKGNQKHTQALTEKALGAGAPPFCPAPAS